MAQSVEADQANAPEPTKGIYVYGILPGDIEITSDRTGVGDPPGQLRVVRSEKLAALVSDVDTSRPLGTPDDLRAHKAILDDSQWKTLEKQIAQYKNVIPQLRQQGQLPEEDDDGEKDKEQDKAKEKEATPAAQTVSRASGYHHR